MQYLGTILTNDIHDCHELVKRIAMAQRDFIAPRNVWKRSSLTWRHKLAVYDALIESELMECLILASLSHKGANSTAFKIVA